MYRCTEAHEIAEERRLLYVAMTRAQNFLVSDTLFGFTRGAHGGRPSRTVISAWREVKSLIKS